METLNIQELSSYEINQINGGGVVGLDCAVIAYVAAGLATGVGVAYLLS